MHQKDQANLFWVQSITETKVTSIEDLRDGSLLLMIIDNFGFKPHGISYYPRPISECQINENQFTLMSILIKYNWLKNCGSIKMDQLFGNQQSLFFLLDLIRQNVETSPQPKQVKQDLIKIIINIISEDQNPYLKLENLYHLLNLNRHKLVHQDQKYLGRHLKENIPNQQVFGKNQEILFARTFAEQFGKQFGTQFGQQFALNFASAFGQSFGSSFGQEIAPLMQQQVNLRQSMEEIIQNKGAKVKSQKQNEGLQNPKDLLNGNKKINNTETTFDTNNNLTMKDSQQEQKKSLSVCKNNSDSQKEDDSQNYEFNQNPSKVDQFNDDKKDNNRRDRESDDDTEV